MVSSGLWGKNEIGFDADDDLSGSERDGVKSGLRCGVSIDAAGLMTGRSKYL